MILQHILKVEIKPFPALMDAGLKYKGNLDFISFMDRYQEGHNNEYIVISITDDFELELQGYPCLLFLLARPGEISFYYPQRLCVVKEIE